MATLGMQMLASALCLLGWVLVIVTCLMPMWRVSAFVGTNIITSQSMYEGIWMSCVTESTGQIQCMPYFSMLALSSDLQAARGLMAVAIVTGGAGLLLAFVGGKCTRFLDQEKPGTKNRIAVAAGALLAATGVFCLVPTSWTAASVVNGFYSSTNDTQRRELGACLYLGWGAAILLILGGAIFIKSSCPTEEDDAEKSRSTRYVVVRSSQKGTSRASSQRSWGAPLKSPPSNGPATPRPAGSSQGASVKSLSGEPLYSQPPLWEGRAGSVVHGPGSSKAPSTKSQLRRAASQGSLPESNAPPASEDGDAPTPPMTYI